MAILALVVGAPAASGERDADPPAAAAGKKKAKKQKKANKKAVKKIRNGRYVGARGDGLAVDSTFCKNGKWRSGSGLGGKKWFVRNAKFNKKGFTAIVAENRKREQGGFTIAIGKRKRQWLYGISLFDEPSSMGKVDRTKAKKECKAL